MTAAAAAASGISIRRAFAAELARARARVAGRSAVAASRVGDIEYAVAGAGRPVLMIHGTGGGFDQGLAFAERLIQAGYRVIAPSRFGYLRSAIPSDPSPESQADAFADLLDHLGVRRISVIGGSAGALSALAFAIRHPDRCERLLPLVPAFVVPGAARPTPTPIGAAIIEYGLRSDFLFWLGLQAAERSLIATLLASDPKLFDAATPEERARVRRILRDILPVSARTEGLMNDARLASRPAVMAMERIAAPTLAISLEDDRFGTFAAARCIAERIPGARMLGYPTGGHVWIGRDRELFGEIVSFLNAR